MFSFSLEPRVQASRSAMLLMPVLAVFLTLIASSIMFVFINKPPLAALYSVLIEPLTTTYGIGEVLLKASPLLIIAQGLAIGFKAKVWNIGADGQLIVGAICASYLAITFEDSSSIFLLPAMVVAGIIGGILWASIAAVLRTRFNANEILVTLMLSSVALQLLYYLVAGSMRDPSGYNFPQSIMFGEAATFSLLMDGVRVNSSVFLAFFLSIAAWFFNKHSVHSFKMRVGGLAPTAAKYAGFNEKNAVWIGLLAGGAAAGIAGVGEVAGSLGILQRNISSGYGFAAIIVAFLGMLNPIGIIFASLFMALIYVGGDMALISVGIPKASTTIFQGILLVLYLCCYLFVNYRIKYRMKNPPAKESVHV